MKTSRAVDDRLEAFALETLEACDAVLVRVWLVGPGDACAACAMRPECPDQRACLHLMVSVGVSQNLEGPYRRFPIGARRVGRVVAERKPYLEHGDLANRGIADPTWLAVHGVQSFAAVPLGEGRGVLAVFSRRLLTDQDVRLLAFAARAAGHGAGDPLPPARDARTPRAELAAPPHTKPPRPGVIAGPPRTLAEIQREAIERVLAETGGRISGPHGAAAALGLKPSTLVSRMQKLGVRRPE